MWLRRNRGLGPERIAGIVKMPESTVHRDLVRHGLNRLDHLDRTTREPPADRHHPTRELVHVDIKNLDRIPAGGGWRVSLSVSPATVLVRGWCCCPGACLM